jgi:hypothetical protein
MIDIAAFITTATSVVGLFDLVADQVQRFIRKDAPAIVPPEHRMKIEREGDTLVSKDHGHVRQRITFSDFEKLPGDVLMHIRTLERSMQNYYAVWSAVYPTLSLETDPLKKAKIEISLKQEVMAMKNDLERILKFLEDCGFTLDDHYLGIRDTLMSYNG